MEKYLFSQIIAAVYKTNISEMYYLQIILHHIE